MAALPLFSQMAFCPQGLELHGSNLQFEYGSPVYPDLHLQLATAPFAVQSALVPQGLVEQGSRRQEENGSPV